mmetsp:Transcript_5063/g.7897  ORF Transcript_5063/g.7897 Transcript_5063/m.7897 type:complete len:80 (+) Transcript_5063:999-1238(+)
MGMLGPAPYTLVQRLVNCDFSIASFELDVPSIIAVEAFESPSNDQHAVEIRRRRLFAENAYLALSILLLTMALLALIAS